MSISEQIEMEFDLICAEIEEEERGELGCSELLEICDKVEFEEPCEFVGPQIELDLGEGSSIFEDVPAVEEHGVVPTVVVDEEDSSVELIVSAKETMSDQAEGAGSAPVPEDAQLVEEGAGVGTGEPVPGDDRSGQAPDLMEVDPAVRIGGDSVCLEEAEAAVAEPDLGSGERDLRMEDFPDDVFEKVGDIHPEESSQTPPVPGPEQSSQSPSGTEPRKKRVKTLAERMDLP